MPSVDQDTLNQLNVVLKDKLTAINQYFLHARILKHMGFVQLADQEYKASIDAMKHSDMLVEHILSLGGLPNLQELGQLQIGDTAEEMLAKNRLHVEAALQNTQQAMSVCQLKGNMPSVALLQKLHEHQQERIRTIHTQLDNLHPNKRTYA